jgi:predicted RNA-binding Zn ribbon-like protein
MNGGDMADTSAPGELRLVQDFINTLDLLPDGKDDWSDPAALAAWLGDRQLLKPRAQLSEDDLRRAQALREALRSLCVANAGGEPDDGALREIQSAADRAGVRLRFARDRAWLDPSADGIDGVHGRLLAIVATAMADGTWPRLKACRADDCLWAFYDGSRNHSGAWCSMASCGIRAKARAYRTRQRAG